MIEENLKDLRKELIDICKKCGRNIEEIKLIVVTKDRTIPEIQRVLRQGTVEIGESRVQEAIRKYHYFKREGFQNIRWHMIGHLQRNKVKEAIRIFDLIHSVDSLKLAWEINKQANKINKIIPILIQINTSGETTKYGIKPEETETFVEKLLSLKNLSIQGLMTIAPLVDDPEKVRPYFRLLREIKEQLNQKFNFNLKILSMGMSQDYRVAVEEGATILRIGRRIFS